MLEVRQLIIRDLIDRGTISESDLCAAHAHAGENQSTILQALIARETISHRDLALARARVSEHPFVDLTRYIIDPENAALIPQSLATKTVAFPIFVSDGIATVGMLNPHDLRAIEIIRQATHHEIEPVVCDETELRRLIATAYGCTEDQHTEIRPATVAIASAPSAGSRAHAASVSAPEEEPHATQAIATSSTFCSPASLVLTRIFQTAEKFGATEIHLSPQQGGTLVRYRVEGAMKTDETDDVRTLQDHPRLIYEAKMRTGLDPTRANEPQESIAAAGIAGPIPASVSTLPTHEGENLVIRIGSVAAHPRGFDELAMSQPISDFFTTAIQARRGVFLVSGPFSSGRTSTVAAAIHYLNTPQRNILTIEDPIETHQPGVRSIRIDPGIGMSLASAIRLAVRQAPDVLLIGEIRDQETAHAAFRAAANGHMVLSTLDADTAAHTLDRVVALGITPLVAASNLVGVLNQRLIGKVCVGCAAPDHDAPRRLTNAGVSGIPTNGGWSLGKGCDACAQTGIAGRIAIHEARGILPHRITVGSLLKDALEKAATGQIAAAQVIQLAQSLGITGDPTTRRLSA